MICKGDQPELDVAVGFVCMVLGFLSLFKRLTGEAYDIGWVIGMYIGFTIGLILLSCGLTVLEGRPVILGG